MNVNFVIEPTHVTQRQIWECYGNGPSSYVASGDPLLFNGTQFPSCVMECCTKSGNYELLPVPSITGNLRPSWKWLWFYSGAQGVLTAVQNVAGSGMTPGTYIINGVGGSGAGAQISVTVLTATTIATPVVLNAGVGYGTTPPTFTVPTGVTPTFTLTIAPVSGLVPAATNLSAETVQFMVLGGEM